MVDSAERMRTAAVERALSGPGVTSTAERCAAFDNAPSAPPLVAVVAKNAWKVTDEDVAAAKRAGLSEDAIFELAVCAAYGEATRQLDAALAAVEDA